MIIDTSNQSHWKHQNHQWFKEDNNHVYGYDNNMNALMCYINSCLPHNHQTTATKYLPVSNSVWKITPWLSVYCGWNQKNFKISIYTHVKKFVLALPSFLLVFLSICSGFFASESCRLIFLLAGCYFLLQDKRTIKWVFLLHIWWSSMQEFYSFFKYIIAYMLITCVNNVNHVNYVNNICNNLIDKLHLT